jgi:hypothetical protein
MATKNRIQMNLRFLEATLEWPGAWALSEVDIPLAIAIRDAMQPFLESLFSEGRSETTLRRFFGSLWLLGGEIVADHSDQPMSGLRTGREILMDSIDFSGGPLLGGHYTEQEQRTFDACCKKLLVFLMHNPGTPPNLKRQAKARG